MPSARAPLMLAVAPGLHREAVEERRLRDVGRLRPVVDLAGAAGDLLPHRVRVRQVAVEPAERRRVARDRQHRGDLVRRRPDVACRYTGLPSRAGAERLGRQVLQHGAGDRVGDDQRRRGEEVRLEVRMDARLEVAVARQHRRADEVVLRDRVVDLGRQVAGVADAGRAAVGGDVEAELLEVGQQPRLLEVLGDDARARRERGLDVRRDRQALSRRPSSRAGPRRAARSGSTCWCTT